MAYFFRSPTPQPLRLVEALGYNHWSPCLNLQLQIIIIIAIIIRQARRSSSSTTMCLCALVVHTRGWWKDGRWCHEDELPTNRSSIYNQRSLLPSLWQTPWSSDSQTVSMHGSLGVQEFFHATPSQKISLLNIFFFLMKHVFEIHGVCTKYISTGWH